MCTIRHDMTRRMSTKYYIENADGEKCRKHYVMVHSGSIVTYSIRVAQIIKVSTLLKSDKHAHNYFTICKQQTSVILRSCDSVS